MIALAELVTVSVLPEVEKLALPELVTPPTGLAALYVLEKVKHAATDSAISLRLKRARPPSLALDMATLPGPASPQQTEESF
jgi:hypothetical protein